MSSDLIQRRFVEHTLQIAIQAADVDTDVVRDVLSHRLGDLDAFVTAIRRRL